MIKAKTIVIFLIIIVLFSAIGIYFAYFRESGPEYVTETAALTTLNQTVEATGKVESAQRIELNFKTSGRIQSVGVDSGDIVKKGQILARLEALALQSRVTDAQAQLEKARADYDALLAGSSVEDIQVQKDTVEQKKQDLESYRNTLKKLQDKSAVEIDNLKETLLIVMGNEIISARNAIEEIDNTMADSDAEDTLAITDKGLITIADNSRDTAKEYVDETEETIDLLSVTSSDGDVLAGSDKTKNMLDLVQVALAKVVDVLQATITSSKLTEAELDTLKTNIQTQQTTINTSRSSLLTAKANWTNKIAYYDDLITSAEDDVKEAEIALQVAKSQLALKEANPREFEINAQKAKITQAQASVSLALANLEETIIRAPMDGIITKKFFEAGEQTSLTSPVLEMIGEATLEIEVDVPESDIAKISIAQPANITLDAFSDDIVFDGIVSFVDPAETILQDVVYYRITVQFETDNEQVKPGMTANVAILTDEKKEVLAIPFRAVKSRNGDRYVQVLENGMVKEKVVTLGLRGDEGVEITSGLNEGDIVITFTQEN